MRLLFSRFSAVRLLISLIGLFVMSLGLIVAPFAEMALAATPVRKAPTKTTTAHKPVARTSVRPGTTKPAVKSAPVNPNEFIQYFNAAKQAFEAGNYTQAETAIKKSLALAEKTNSPTSRNMAILSNLLGITEFKLGHYTEAANALQRAVSIYSRSEQAASHQRVLMGEYILLGQIAMYKGDYSAAQNAYQSAKLLAEALAEPDKLRLIQRALSDIAQIDAEPDYLAQVVGTSVVRWSQPNQPILVYVADGDSVSDWKPENRALVFEAFEEWQQAMGSRLQFQFVSTSEEADIRVGWMDAPVKSTPEELARGHLEWQIGLCHTKYLGEHLSQDDIDIAVHNTDRSVFSQNALYNTLLHEIAHAIGMIHGHSPNPDDALFASSSYEDGHRKHLTARDIATAHKLYDLPPQITNPAGVNLVRYGRFATLREEAANAYNAGDYPTALTGYQQALTLYNGDPEVMFWAGMASWKLDRYDQAFSYFTDASTRTGQYQGESLKLAGVSLLLSGQQDDKSGSHTAAEGKYRRAYQLLSQGLPRTPMSAENAKGIRDTLGWLNQRLAMRSLNVIQWANGAPPGSQIAASSSDSDAEGKPKKKKHWWSFEPSGYTSQVPVRIMMPGRMMGY